MDISREFDGASLPDKRLRARLLTLAEALAQAPEKSFPKASGGDAGLEATYRFLNNERVEPDVVLGPHIRATVDRCAAVPLVVVAHDTTEFSFPQERPGLGRLSTRNNGFLGHFALAMTPDRRPLGLLGMSTIFRGPKAKKRAYGPASESRRWGEMVKTVEARVATPGRVVHVMDREGDFYELLAALGEQRARYVIRLQVDRRVESGDGPSRLSDALGGQPIVTTREVPIAERRAGDPMRKPPRRNKKHPPRRGRTARLEIRAKSVVLVGAGGRTLSVNVVSVCEVDAPEGTTPVQWKLATTESIANEADVLAVVDTYRARWTIEEYFRALKQGCAYESRQLETRRALLNALALLAPIAWKLLMLRQLSRDQSDIPAIDVLGALKTRILEGHKKTKLKPGATITEAARAIAKLGGHITNNGDPGWIVLGRGFHDLLMMEAGALLALGKM